MDSSDWIRGMMTKLYETEKMLVQVVDTIRRQLHGWNEGYPVKLLEELLEKDIYYVVVTKNNASYRVTLPKHHITTLQETSPYALDKHIWNMLNQQGLQVRDSKRHHLKYLPL